MKTAGIIIAAIVILGVIYMFSQQNSGGNDNSLTFDTVQADVASGAQLIDVRSPGEYRAGHINGAINLDVVAIQEGARPSVEKSQKLYLYCRSGSRSGQATSILKNAGYQNIVDLGAMTKVQSIGGTITN